jgi:alpha-galactosidase
MNYYLIIFLIMILNPALFCQESRQNDYSEFILTPAPPFSPRINGPKVYGVRPGNPVIYRIPCTGERPITYSIENLPEGLLLDNDKGIITGSIPHPGTYELEICAKNVKGDYCRDLKIIVGNKLALTPPMGWNSWYIHYDRISDQLMRQAADQMIETGMADYGYQYVSGNRWKDKRKKWHH